MVNTIGVVPNVIVTLLGLSQLFDNEFTIREDAE
jgi:hypothetical protein